MSDNPNSLVQIGTRGRIRWVYRDIFVVTFAPDCMTHACRCRDEGDRQLDDACCQHGCDVDLYEKAAILARQAEIAPVLHARFKDPSTWFDESDPEHDEQAYPSGTAVRSGRAGPGEADGCVFLQHDGRGCALHRAALEHGFAPEEIKPAVCRLYPLAIDGDYGLGLADDFARYSCASYPGGPTVYRLMRGTLADLFGKSLVRRLDQIERSYLGRRLPLAASM
jgi:Fe-S-cluster containining protein